METSPNVSWRFIKSNLLINHVLTTCSCSTFTFVKEKRPYLLHKICHSPQKARKVIKTFLSPTSSIFPIAKSRSCQGPRESADTPSQELNLVFCVHRYSHFVGLFQKLLQLGNPMLHLHPCRRIIHDTTAFLQQVQAPY